MQCTQRALCFFFRPVQHNLTMELLTLAHETLHPGGELELTGTLVLPVALLMAPAPSGPYTAGAAMEVMHFLGTPSSQQAILWP